MADEEVRPSPEELLEIANREEKSKRGKLTIYFGAAPGVGKTYAMLSDAHARKAEGIDVVIGYVETHKRPETEALLDGLEIIPPLITDYKGIKLQEVPIEKIKERKPQLVIIDELAHTNAPGSKNMKRYQDIEEILNYGIDVYTAMNVQHLESLKDVVFQITNIRVHETVPDKFVMEANEIKLVDLPPEELLKRLRDGKVYVKDMAEQAVHKFFRPGNLLALRQLALRVLADNVDEKMRNYMKAHAIAGPWVTKERVLVGIFASPYAEKLVRATYRLANELGAEWIALHVETGKNKDFSAQENKWLNDALELARSLGGWVAWVKGNDVTHEIINYAKSHNVNKIIIGKPKKAGLFHTISDRFIFEAKGIDIYMIETQIDKTSFERPKYHFRVHEFLNYLSSAAGVALATGISLLLKNQLTGFDMMFIFLIPLVLTALYLGIGPSIFAIFLSILTYDYLFTRPYFSFEISDFSHLISFVVYTSIVVVISILASQSRKRVFLLKESESRSNALYEFSRDLATVESVDNVLSLMVNHIKRLFNCEIAIFLLEGEKLSIVAKTENFEINTESSGIASWVLINKKPAGFGTETISNAKVFCLPLMTSKDEAIGVIEFDFMGNKQILTMENIIVLETISHIGAMAIERIKNITNKTDSN
ncbi:DUF4118 domain-containing protein [Athalassotoga saccharophila]|uniref:DUF4118 domain-containing protein n=1 Tax=Athalassotoga saccharophila TaxID=1441386 RepID=UPI0013798C2A|nr:DUF4118 domain-containing protein [Athalassotoga saccharophila]BBJ28480.1 osmosensitive K+ channel histidine kinase KdpD [Athalassotoga saccharophila]